MQKRKTKTEELLRDTFIELTKEKKFDKISITDLTERANINRGTFYLHYKDMRQMIDTLESELTDFIKETIQENALHMIAKEYYYPLYSICVYVKQHMVFLKSMLGMNGDPEFLYKIRETLVDIFMKYISPLFKQANDPAVMHAACIFIVAGCMGTFMDWVNNDCVDSASKVIRGLEDLLHSKFMSNTIPNV